MILVTSLPLRPLPPNPSLISTIISLPATNLYYMPAFRGGGFFGFPANRLLQVALQWTNSACLKFPRSENPCSCNLSRVTTVPLHGMLCPCLRAELGAYKEPPLFDPFFNKVKLLLQESSTIYYRFGNKWWCHT